MTLTDAHCHFFSPRFFGALARDLSVSPDDVPRRLQWDAPGSNEALTERWMQELDAAGVSRAMLIASTPGDEDAVATAVSREPTRVVGAFMIDAAAPDASSRADRAFGELKLRVACLFPAMHHVAVDDPRSLAVFEAAARHDAAMFVHCGVLSIGVRKKLGLPSRFDLRLGDPLAVAAAAQRFPGVPVIVPHFGAGFFREALMAASVASNIRFDTSSSNAWMRTSGLTLKTVFGRALECVGARRLLFGTDSSFFPRGWQRPIFAEQAAALEALGVSAADRALIFGGNFDMLFPVR